MTLPAKVLAAIHDKPLHWWPDLEEIAALAIAEALSSETAAIVQVLPLAPQPPTVTTATEGPTAYVRPWPYPNAAPQVGASGQPHTNAKTIGDSPAVAACSGPDFNQEVNLHADTIAERHDANWTCGCGHVNGCNLEWCAMCLRRPNGRHKDE